jgi:hypothetical protein
MSDGWALGIAWWVFLAMLAALAFTILRKGS